MILEKAAANIRAFHEKQVRQSFIINNEAGIVMGQKVIPMDRVGIYVPGGTAAYPSTVLMDSIPAKIAGVPEVVITTPPSRDGKVNPVIPEVVNQICFRVIGNDLTVTFAAEAGQLQLNVMEPVIVHSIISSIRFLPLKPSPRGEGGSP